MNTAHTTATTIANEWIAGNLTKWEAYGSIFDLVDRRRISLTEAVEILEMAGIRPEVTRMRRRDYLAMKGSK